MKRMNKWLSISIASIITIGLAIIPFKSNEALAVETPWGPERKTFTWEDPAPYATFNSITNNPQLGDERNFVRIREVKDNEHYGDEVTLEAGKTYEVYIYYHNNADGHEVGKTAIGIADGASVKSSFPATVKAGERTSVSATIFASDTDPLAVWDGAYMNSNQDLYLRYVPGTAIIHNGGALDGQSIGPDYLFKDGALLGYNKFSGILPGCNDYAGYVTYQIFADAPGFNISKSVEGDIKTVKAGDVVTFKVRYDNTGTMNQNDVVIKDAIPEELEYVKGSTKLYNNNFENGKEVNDDIVSENGMNIGDYAGSTGWAEVTYQAMVKDGVACGAELVNVAIVSTNDGNKEDSVKLTVDGDNCTPPTEEDCKTNPNLPGCEKNCKTNPEMEGCQELPSTGPLEIVMAVIVVLGIGGGGYYLYRTRRTLKATEKVASGKVLDADKVDKKEESSTESDSEHDTTK